MIVRTMSNFGSSDHVNSAKINIRSKCLPAELTQFRRKMLVSAVFASLLSTLPTSVTADNSTMLTQNSACLPALITPRPLEWPQAVQTLPTENGFMAQPIRIEADQMEQQTPQIMKLFGDVQLQHPQALIFADKITINSETKDANVSGNIRLLQKNFSLTTQYLDIQQNRVNIAENRYQILPSRAYGESKQILIEQQNKRATLNQASLTTCKLQSNGAKDWNLQARKLIVDQKKQRVIAKDTTIYLKDIPIFYSPYFDYPLNDRASGLLFPEFGSYKALNKDRRTQFAKIPYYFALAQNYDDTLTVIPMSQHGLGIDNEFRYFDYLGQGQQNWLFKTGIYRSDEEEDTQNPRWRVALQSQLQWSPEFSTDIDWNQTSDENVYNDAPLDSKLTNATYAPQKARLNYQKGHFSAYALQSGYQELIHFQNNYEKRPEVGMQYQQTHKLGHIGNIDWLLASQVGDFRLQKSDSNRQEGVRWHNQASGKIEKNNAYSKLNAQVTAYYTQYQLDNSQEENRALMQTTLNGGLIFDRSTRIGNQRFTQTLEPKIQYQYTPYRQQSQLPLFDSALRSLDFSNLFATNPYVGSDRIADSNKISMAVESRFIDAYGKERLKVGLGRQYRFEKSQVLEQDNYNGASRISDIYTLAQLNLNNLRLNSTLLFDPQQSRLNASSNRAFWQINQRNELYLNHIKFNKQDSEASESLLLGGYSQLDRNWQLSLLGNYDFNQGQTVESQLGVKYDSCCWAISMVAERTQYENDLYNDSIQFQFELKGLSNNDNSLKKNLNNTFNF